VSTMQPGVAKIIEKVPIWRHCEWTETDIDIAENVGGINYTDTWSSKRVNWLSKSQSPDCRTTYYGCEDRLEHNTGVAQALRLITSIDSRAPWQPRIHRLPAIHHNPGWVDYSQVDDGSFTAIPVLDPVNVVMAYRYSASRRNCLQWHLWLPG
jgi:hypothetical protein